jgi:glycosyltransferase involved in cell wall biosynthesis
MKISNKYPMKVLLISREFPPYEKGGICWIAVYMARFAKKHGVDLTLIVNHPFLKIKKDKIYSNTVYRVPSMGPNFMTQIPSFGYYASSLARKIESDFDVIYSIYSPLFGKFKKPLIAGFQSSRYGEYKTCRENGKLLYALLNMSFIPFESLLIKKAGALTVNSHALTGELRKMGSGDKLIGHIPTGVDTDLFKPLNNRQFQNKQKTILCVARLDIRKGIDYLLHAFREALETVDAKLIICGDGIERDRLQKLAVSLSLPVQFKGFVQHDQLIQLYNNADLFILPSLYEGMPLASLESMACGTPTLISSASPDIGLPRFQKGDVKSLKEIILTYITSENKLKDLSDKALTTSKNYSWEKIVEDTYSFISRFR